MGAQFIKEAEKIKGLAKVLEEMTKPGEFRNKPWEIETAQRTRKIVDLKIDKETQTACFILDEKLVGEETAYNRIIFTYHKGKIHKIEPINYLTGEKPKKEHSGYYPFRWDLIEKPEKEYSKVTKMQGGRDPLNPSKYNLSIECTSETGRIYGSLSFR